MSDLNAPGMAAALDKDAAMLAAMGADPGPTFGTGSHMTAEAAPRLAALEAAVRVFLEREGYATPTDAQRDGGVLASHLQAVWDALGEPDPWQSK